MRSVRLVVKLLRAERRLYGYVAAGGMAGARVIETVSRLMC
jgi:hypothetical protein